MTHGRKGSRLRVVKTVMLQRMCGAMHVGWLFGCLVFGLETDKAIRGCQRNRNPLAPNHSPTLRAVVHSVALLLQKILVLKFDVTVRDIEEIVRQFTVEVHFKDVRTQFRNVHDEPDRHLGLTIHPKGFFHGRDFT